MESALQINQAIAIPQSELKITTSRSSGPGGQHVQKTSSRVQLRWNIATSQVLTDKERALLLERLESKLVGEEEILITVESERSQLRNKEHAFKRLAQIIRRALLTPKKRIKTKATKSSQIKRVDNKKRRGQLKKLRRLVHE